MSRIRSKTLLSAAALFLASMAAYAAEPIPPNQTPQDLVNALRSAFGEHHARAVHAKGILLEGTFTATKAARTLSKEPIFNGVTMPVVARFSDFTGIPDIPDNIGDANPRGFAFKVKTKGGAVDVVSHSFNGFPVATGDEFAAFLRAVGASGPSVPHPTPIEQFLGDHPIAKAFLTSQKPPPVSYATTAYFGVNSFRYTDAKDKPTYVRYRFVPRAGEHYLTPDALKATGPNYLREEIAQRLAKTPVVFDWYAQIAGKDDAIENPSIAWPASRKLVKIGTITITKVADDQDAIDKQTLFLPGEVHPGIAPADPMLTLRNNAYPISFKGRQ
jgi:catalase